MMAPWNTWTSRGPRGRDPGPRTDRAHRGDRSDRRGRRALRPLRRLLPPHLGEPRHPGERRPQRGAGPRRVVRSHRPRRRPALQPRRRGPDDMPAHLRTAVTSTSETIPIVDGRLALGTWQGVYLFEHRTSPHRRQVVVHVQGTSGGTLTESARQERRTEGSEAPPFLDLAAAGLALVGLMGAAPRDTAPARAYGTPSRAGGALRNAAPGLRARRHALRRAVARLDGSARREAARASAPSGAR